MKVFCVSSGVSNLYVNSFVDGWTLNNPDCVFDVFDLNSCVEEAKNKVGFSVQGLSCKDFVSLCKDNFSGNEFYEDEGVVTDFNKGCFSNSCDSLDYLFERYCDFSLEKIFWLDSSQVSVSFGDENVDNISVFYRWIKEYFDYLDDSILLNEDIDKVEFLVTELKKILDKDFVGVYQSFSSMVDMKKDFLDSLKEKNAGFNLEFIPFMKASSKKNEASVLVNLFQRYSANSKASVCFGSYSPIGFLLSVLGNRLVYMNDFISSFYDLDIRVKNCDLVVLLEKELNLLNVNSSMIGVLKNYVSKYAVPFLVVGSNVDLSRVELNEYQVSGAYETDFSVDAVKNMGFRLSSTWKF